jgi:hypothetical protein
MPVFAQSCRKGPSEVKVEDPVAESIRRARQLSGLEREYAEDDSGLQGAINAVRKARNLQTANAAKFLAATSGRDKHKFAGQNMSVSKKVVGAGGNAVTVNGYITDKGLFKPWESDALMSQTSGKFGCPIRVTPEALPSGFTYDSSGNKNYVGAPFDQSGNAVNEPSVFVGSTKKMAQGNLLPACGNEGINVEVVYPSKATGSTYKGTFNINPVSTTGYELQRDVRGGDYEACMKRAEDKGMPIFAYTGNKCYIHPGPIESAMSAGLGIDLNPVIDTQFEENTSYNMGGQKILHFGNDGTLNILNTATPTDKKSNIVFSIGRPEPVVGCHFSNGGAITAISGTWGENCKTIPKTYKENGLVATYNSRDIYSAIARNDQIRLKKATEIYDVRRPETPLPGGYCNRFFGDCGRGDGRFDEWIRRGGSCPNQRTGSACKHGCEQPAPRCATGCEYWYQDFWGKWKTMCR